MSCDVEKMFSLRILCEQSAVLFSRQYAALTEYRQYVSTCVFSVGLWTCSVSAFYVFCLVCFHTVTLAWHIYNAPPLEDKTLCLCMKCKVKCPKPVVTITLNSLPTMPWWLRCDRLPWLPDIEGTSPSIYAVAIASTLPGSNLPSLFPLFSPPSIASSPCNTNAIHSEKRGEGRGWRLSESCGSRRAELKGERGNDEQQGL